MFTDAASLRQVEDTNELICSESPQVRILKVVPQEQYLNYQRNGLRRLSSLVRLRSVKRCMAAPPYYQQVRNG